MAKIKNQRLYSDDPEQLKKWAEEVEFIGRPYHLDYRTGTLTIFAIDPRKRGKKKKREKEARNKRAESAARRNT